MNFSLLSIGEEKHDAAEAFDFLRKESLDVFNRLHSIAEDIKFVTDVCNAYPDLPVMRKYVHPHSTDHY